MTTAKASGTPHPGDRTFVGQPKPCDPAEIGLGSVVLAHEGLDEGWWEAEVIGINGRVFSLRWRDYPTRRPFCARLPSSPCCRSARCSPFQKNRAQAAQRPGSLSGGAAAAAGIPLPS